MNSKQAFSAAILSIPLFSLPLNASTEPENPRWYDGGFSIGASLGIADANFDVLNDADSEIYLEAFGRYKLKSGFSADASLVSMGQHTNNDVYETEIDTLGGTLQLGYFWDISQDFSLYARGGFFLWQAEASRLVASSNNSLPSNIDISTQKIYDDKGIDLTVGLGVDYHLTKNISVGGNYQHYRMDHGEMNTFSLSGGYTF